MVNATINTNAQQAVLRQQGRLINPHRQYYYQLHIRLTER